MDIIKYIQMINDSSFFDLKKMSYKYTKEEVRALIKVLKQIAYRAIPLKDFSGSSDLVFIEAVIGNSRDAGKKLLIYRGSAPYSIQALEDEIASTFQIEQINTSRESIRNILDGRAPKGTEEFRVWGMKQGFEFISDRANTINEENLRKLYELAINPYLEDKKDMLADGQLYRDDDVLVGNILSQEKVHDGLQAEKIKERMDSLFAFINEHTDMDDLAKAAAIHFYIGYIHPYFDGNGRMARLLHCWYLLQNGYSATLYLPFSSLIEETRIKYNKAYELVEQNEKISGCIDISPFLSYFNEYVYRKIGSCDFHSNTLEAFNELLKQGEITGKERELFSFVISNYGMNQFSTKDLEKDFENCAYATIRTFVLKMTEKGLFEEHLYKNRRKYSLASTQISKKKEQ
ncbi:MAG: Fic family protein [Clostridia bacterium]|nr:Fic family protein [Clostridia bacterium]